MKTSLKEMLRDRITKMQAVDLALKWCKAKERWINHTYDNFINIYVDKKDRYSATRTILGISSKYRNFDFSKTIDWENLNEYENAYWKSIESWVIWFTTNLAYIEQDVSTGITKEELDSRYNMPKLSKYLIENLS